MLDYFKKKYDELLASVFDPIINAILAWSWKARFAFLLVLGAAITAWTNKNYVEEAATYSQRLAQVFYADSNKIPLTKHLVQRLSEARGRLLFANQNDVNMLGTGDITGWSASQALLGIADAERPATGESKLIKYIRQREIRKCNCWAELNNEDEERAWTFISGWVLAALAESKIAASKSEIAFLLSNQNPDGSWSSIPVQDLPQYASTYTTSWAIIGLLKQLNSSMLSNPEDIAGASNAVRRGAAWLLANRQKGARWKPYPNLQSSSISGSVSGLAIHTLHMAVPDQMRDIDKQWLDNIPRSPVPASIGENSYVEIKRGGTVRIDHFVQLTMPWMLIGTVDAYSQGSLFQKARALTWIESTIMHDSVKNADAEQNNWWRAELLISINYLYSNVKHY